MREELLEDRVSILVTSTCRWVDLRTSGVEARARDALIERHRLPPLVGRLDDCARGRPRVELHEDGALLIVLPAGGRTLALLVAGALLVTVGEGEARLQSRLRRTHPTGAAGLAAAAIELALAERGRPASRLARERVLRGQRGVLAELAGHLPVAAAGARLAELAEVIADERVTVGAPRRAAWGVTEAAIGAAWILACVATWRSHGHAVAWAAAHAGLCVCLFTSWRAHAGRNHAA